MKHIKAYKIFESFREDKIREDIKDIFQSEVGDSRFVLLDWSHKVGRENFGFKVQKQSIKTRRLVDGYPEGDLTVVEPFQVMELADFIERVLDYSDMSPCEIQIYVPLSFEVEFITKRDLTEARNSKLGFFSDYSTHTIIIKIRVFQ